MITKAIIIDRNINSNKYNIRIPYLETAGSKTTYYEAILATIPGISNAYAPNDVVLVSFEDKQADKPVILGKLFVEDEEFRGQFKLGSLQVDGASTLSSDTVVGDINVYERLQELTRRTDNIADNVGDISESSTVDAEDVSYDNTASGLTAINVQSAIDEVSSEVSEKVGDVKINGTSIVTSGSANIVTNSAYNASTNKIATMSDLPTPTGITITDLR